MGAYPGLHVPSCLHVRTSACEGLNEYLSRQVYLTCMPLQNVPSLEPLVAFQVEYVDSGGDPHCLYSVSLNDWVERYTRLDEYF